MAEQSGTKPLTVLLADDDAAAVDVLSKLLITAGYRCLPTGGGAAAYRVFLHSTPDLVVTDLNMPSGDGYTFIDRIREERDTPVVAITGLNASEAQKRMSEQYTGVHVLAKPFGREPFLKLVRELLARHAAGRAVA